MRSNLSSNWSLIAFCTVVSVNAVVVSDGIPVQIDLVLLICQGVNDSNF
jgi:hypothetical protein